jgi:hypothetical protein
MTWVVNNGFWLVIVFQVVSVVLVLTLGGVVFAGLFFGGFGALTAVRERTRTIRNALASKPPPTPVRQPPGIDASEPPPGWYARQRMMNRGTM